MGNTEIQALSKRVDELFKRIKALEAKKPKPKPKHKYNPRLKEEK